MNSNNFENKKSEILNLFKEKKYDLVIRLGTKLIKKKIDDPQLIYLLGLATINLENILDAEIFREKLIKNELKENQYNCLRSQDEFRRKSS